MNSVKNKLTEILIPSIGFLTVLFSLLIGKVNLYFLIFISLFIILTEVFFIFRKNVVYTPYLLLLLTPITLIQYSTIRDFQIRVFTFIFITYIISFILRQNSVKSISENYLVNRIKLKPDLSPFKIYSIAFLIFIITSLLLFNKGIYLSGDEPHYLTITQSIIEDGDFDLKNNYKKESYYLIKPELKDTNWKISPHLSINNKYARSFHMPGVSFLMIPFYGIFKLLNIAIHPAIFFRFAMIFYNAFFALSLFYLLKFFFKDKNVLFFWLMIISTFPILFHSISLYPEIPAALISINIFIFGFTENKNYFLTGLFIALLPWFHVKYYPVLLIFLIFIAIRLFKEWQQTKTYKHILHFLILPTISLILLMTYCKILYGTINPTQIFPKQNYFVDMFLKVKVFFAYFLDQRDGLITYSPYLFFLFFGLKKKFKYRSFLFFIASAYVLLHAFTTVRGAYAPAGRPLIFVIWVFIIFIAHFYFNISDYKNSWGSFIFKLSTGLTYFFTAWFFYYPFFMYQPVFSNTKNRYSDIFNFLGSDNINLPSIFPSFITHPSGIYIPNIIWISILIISITFFYLKKNKQKNINLNRRKYQIITSIFIFFVLVFTLTYYPHIHLQKRNRFAIGSIQIYKTAQLFHHLKDIQIHNKPGKFFRLKEGYEYDLYINLNKKRNLNKRLLFKFNSDKNTNISVYTKNKNIKTISNKKKFNFEIKLNSIKKLKIKNSVYGVLTIKTKKSSTDHIYLSLFSY